MLPWQPKKLHKRTKFFSKLMAWSFVIHAIAVFCLLFIYNGHTVNLMMQVRSVPSDIKVKLVSFNRRVALSQKGNAKGGLKTVKKKVVKRKPAPKTKKTTLAKKTVAKKPVSKPKPIVKKKIEAKKPAPKKVVEKKKVAPKPVEKKQTEKPAVKPESKKVEKKQVEKPVVKEEVPVAEDNLYEVADQKEFDALQLQALLQDSVAEVWTPPVGMVDSIECIVTVSVDWKGNIIEKNIDKKSGVLVYDMTVERALDDLKIPRAAWGKSMTVAFKP